MVCSISRLCCWSIFENTLNRIVYFETLEPNTFPWVLNKRLIFQNDWHLNLLMLFARSWMRNFPKVGYDKVGGSLAMTLTWPCPWTFKYEVFTVRNSKFQTLKIMVQLKVQFNQLLEEVKFCLVACRAICDAHVKLK